MTRGSGWPRVTPRGGGSRDTVGDDEECQAPAAWRRRAAAGAVAGAIGLGLREALIPGPGEPEVVEVRDIESEPASQIDLYFHPQVPEATLVVVRRRQ